ncbi:MAG: hypothetical protein IKA90_03705 [Clostridia bacterium]|nr:hypothetical protein [Clostridia bacterium]
MAEFLLEVEVIRTQRKSMLDSLKKMQEVNEALAESATEYKSQITDMVTEKTLAITQKVSEQIEEIKAEVTDKLNILEEAAQLTEDIENDAASFKA